MSRWSVLLMLALACTPRAAPESAVEPAAATEIAPGQVIKSPIDQRDFRNFTLDNGMKVLVVSDPDADLAAASLDVHVGQFSDPLERQGLAHFLEHMLFMGTDKYPDVDDYRRFIQDHGGSTNAGTGQEHTSYFFSIADDQLEGGLDRFSRFFVAPKLDPEYVARERNAVNSEYSLKVKEDARRIREVQRKTSNPQHPFAKFSVGNLDTLADLDGRPVWDDLKAFYASEYTASRMTLAVIGTEPVDALESMVRSRFAEVPTDGKAAKVPEVPLFTADQLGATVHITPLADMRMVELQFPVPPELPVHDKHPIGYLTRLLGHEGEGSLYVLLRDKGWIESLSAGTEGTEDTTLITVGARLTEEGWTHRDDVVDAVFQYIRLLRSQPLPTRLHDEAATLAAQSFAWSEPASPVGTVRSAVWALQDHPPEHVLDHWAQYGDFDEALVRQWLDKLTPENLHLLVIGPDLETDKVEARYDAPYALRPLDPKLMETWRTSTIDPALQLPAPNPYIAKDLVLKPAPEGADKPAKVIDSEGFVLWHHHDDSFGVPKGRMEVAIFSPLASQGPKERLMNGLLSTLIDDSLQTVRYPAREAGLSMDVGTHPLGLRLTVSGYDPKLADLMGVMSERLAGFQVDEDRFEVLKGRLVRELRNVATLRPIQQGLRAVGDVFDPASAPADVQLGLAEALTVKDLQAYADHVLDGASARMLVHGNLTRAEAGAAGKKAKSTLVKDKPAPVGTVGGRRVPDGQELALDLSIDHDDTVLLVHYRGDEASVDEQARFRVLGAVLKTSFFTEIRTKQQLGYTTFAYFTADDLLPGLGFGIQSSSAGPKTLLDRVNAFIADQADVLDAMSDAELETIKLGLITQLLETETRLDQRTDRYRSDLWYGFEDFDRRDQLAEAIGKVDKQALTGVFHQTLLSKSTGRVIVRSAGHAHADERTQKPECTDAACVIKRMGDVVARTP